MVSEQADLEESNRWKISKHDAVELKYLVRRRYGKQEVTMAAVTISMRGIWSKLSAAVLRKWRIINGMNIWILSSRVVIGTLAC